MFKTIESRISKGLYIILVFSICISIFSISVFANEGEESDSSSSPLAPDLEQQELYTVSMAIAQKAVDAGVINATAASDYGLQIYTYLQQSIRPVLNDIKNNTAGLSNISDMADDLERIMKFIAGDGSAVPASTETMWQLLNKMYQSMLSGKMSINGTETMSVLGYLPLINSSLNGINGQSIFTVASSNNSILGLIAGHTNDINTKMDNIDKLSWTAYNPSNFHYYGTSSVIEGPYDKTAKTFEQDLYIMINLGGGASGAAYKIDNLPYNNMSVYSPKRIEIYEEDHLQSGHYHKIESIWAHVQNRTAYFSSLPENLTDDNIIIHFYFDDDLYEGVTHNANTSTPSVSVLSSNNINNWQFREVISTFHIEQLIDNLNNELASANMTAAKKASEAVINDTLDNFTGSGSAAAKRSDTSSMKNVSSALRSGLDAGGSVSDALSVFNINSDIWGWFSQDNYNNINNLSTQDRRLLKSDNEPEVYDFYSENQITLNKLLGGK